MSDEEADYSLNKSETAGPANEEEYREVLRQWSTVAETHASALHFNFQADYNPDVIQQRTKTFIEDPTRTNFESFWGLLHAATRLASPTSIYTKWHQDREKTDEELADLVEQIRTADTYNPEWESILGARNSLRELFGTLHIEDFPIVNSSTKHGLQFFGYQSGNSYEAVTSQFENFKEKYVQIVGHATQRTDHEVPINFEIDQLFNVIDKVAEDDLPKESHDDVREFYRLVVELKSTTESERDAQTRTEIPSTASIWQISPGRDGQYWLTWFEGGFASIGFDKIQRPTSDEEETGSDWSIYESEPRNTGKGMLYQFHQAMDEGDIVVAKTGTKATTQPDTIYGIGTVTGSSYEESTGDNVPHHDRIPVEWIETFGDNGIPIRLDDDSDSIKSYTLDYLDERYYETLIQQIEAETGQSITGAVRVGNLQDAVERSYYWVNQTKTEEIEAEYLSAGVDDHWSHDLTVLDEEDIIFHYHDGAVIGYSTVTEEARKVETDTDLRYHVAVDFHHSDRPLPLREVRDELSKPAVRDDLTGYPITRAGRVQQAYLCSLTPVAGKYLLQELGASLPANYFWVSVNPSTWHPDEIRDGGDVFYTAYNENGNKKQRFGAFEAAQPGDRVVFYISSPVRKTVAEGRITRGLHEESTENGDLVDGITIEYVRSLDPIPWMRLEDDSTLAGSDPIRTNARGSLFKLTENEFETILELGKSTPSIDGYDGVEEAVTDIRSRIEAQPDIENVLETQLSTFIIKDWAEMLKGVEPQVELSPSEEAKADQLLSLYQQNEQELDQLTTEIGSGSLGRLTPAETLFIVLLRELQAKADLTPNLNQVKFGVLRDEHYTVELPIPTPADSQLTDDELPSEPKPQGAETIRRQLTKAGQVVFYGPPGTGKTYTARRFAHWWLNEQCETAYTSQLRTVTFHPSFSYEDFIEGLTATESDSGGVTYEIVPGVFKRLAERAREAYQEAPDDPRPYILIIDEINRGNLSQIFGETITGLEMDKRLHGDNQTQISLAHSKAPFTIPPNLYVLGTMNTADRSIALVDAALRRRFRFLSFPPDYEVLYELHGFANETAVIETAQSDSDPYRRLLALSITAVQQINDSILEAADLGKGNQIGHSYLLNIDSVQEIVETWRYEILPLLEEYYFGQVERIRTELFTGEGGALFDWQNEEIRDFGSQELAETLAQMCGYDNLLPNYETRTGPTDEEEYRATLNLLLEANVLETGDVLVFDPEKIPPDCQYDEAESFWRCSVTGEQGQNNGVEWEYDDNPYSLTGLSKEILDQVWDDDPPSSGPHCWLIPEHDHQDLLALQKDILEG